MFHLFDNSNIAVRILGNLIIVSVAVMAAVQISLSIYESDKSDFIEYTSLPTVLSAKTLTPQNDFNAGDSFVVEYHVRKYEIGCFAEYVTFANGPVSIQFPSRKSQFVGPRGTFSENDIRVFLTLPDGLPSGDYKIQLIVFPTCNGIQRDAFSLDDGITQIHVQ